MPKLLLPALWKPRRPELVILHLGHHLVLPHHDPIRLVVHQVMQVEDVLYIPWRRPLPKEEAALWRLLPVSWKLRLLEMGHPEELHPLLQLQFQQ